MRRVEVTTKLSPKLKVVLRTLLDLDQETLEAAWRSCSQSGRGYFVYQIKQAPSGKVREIHTPQPAIYRVQKRILKRVLYSLPISRAAFGGVPKRSHVAAAKHHLKQPGEVIQTDISNAFGRTAYSQISKVLRHQLKPTLWAFSLNKEQRKTIVGWLTHLMVVNPQGGRFPSLPLGTPTSLAVFNLVWAPIDAEILKLCHQLSPQSPIRYTRYVDDMTFSAVNSVPTELLPRLGHLIDNYGYQLNTEKTRQAQREAAVIHGLCWRDGQLDLPDQTIIRLAQRVHRLNSLIAGHPTSKEWRNAAQLLQELDFLVHEVYGEGLRPQGLVISEQIRAKINIHQHTPARWADELWG